MLIFFMAIDQEFEKENIFLQTVLDNIADGVVACNSEGTLTVFNQASREFHGLPEKSITPDLWAKYYDLFEVDGKTPLVKERIPLYRALTEGKVENAEMSINPKNAKPRFIVANGRAMKDKNGKTLGAVVVMRDQTDIKILEQHQLKLELEKQQFLATEENSKQFQALANAIPQLAWIANPDDHIFWYNQRWYDYTGATPEQMIGWGWQRVHNPELLPRVLKKWKENLASGDLWEDEFQLKSKSGEYRWFLSRAQPFKNSDGKIMGWFGTNTDVEDTTKLQRELLDTIESMNDAFVAIDKNWCITMVNSKTETLSNLKREEQIGKNVWDLYYPNDTYKNTLSYINYKKTMNERVNTYFEDFYAPLNIWIAARVFPKSDGGIALFITDITQIKKSDIEIKKAAIEAVNAKKEAEHANELKSAFLANMSHEIRTPLGAMIGFADLLRDPGITNTERTNYIDIITRNGEQLSVIINDILDLSKVEAGHLTLEYVPIEPETITSDVISLLQVKAKEKDLALEYILEPSTPKTLYTDPTRVRQILLNLVGNAIKFTNFGSVKVRVSGQKSPLGEEILCFEIKDTGIGISPSQKENVFEMFVQADGTTTRRFGGTGLGLALSRHLARALSGEIIISESREGFGTTFLITIPNLPHKFTNEISVTTSNKNDFEMKELALLGKRILVVDDAPDNQQLIWRYLTKEGAIVHFADNGLTGYKSAIVGNFDLIIMDLQMPIMDGYTATAKLRSTGYKKPIVALTAHAMSEVRKKCLNMGYTDHLIKPINRMELIRTIAKLTH